MPPDRRSDRFLDTQQLVTSRRRAVPTDGLAAILGDEDAPIAESRQVQIFARPSELGAHDWAVYLLRRAAQVEHALLVQYLFAAFTLKPGVPVGNRTTTNWQRDLARIAKEEMGHLLIVQNLLRLIGGPLAFDREELPIATDLYPFDFQLERITKDSLAKYVFAEMTADELPPQIISAQKRMEIEERARRAANVEGGSFINHVGTLYNTLIDVFENDLQEGPDGDFRTDRVDWLAGSTQFRGTSPRATNDDGTLNLTGVKALAPTNKADALIALRVIGQQGEAADEPTGGEESHFERFLVIYDECPEDTSALTFPVVTNPNTRAGAPDAGTIPAGTAVSLWAHVFNVRYRILLTALTHALTIPAVSQGAETPRSGLIEWVYQEMTGSASLRALAGLLARLPLSAGSSSNAGPPFELPYALILPDLAPERWRLHRDLVTSSQRLVQELRAAGETSDLLDEVAAQDQAALDMIESLKDSGF